MGRDNKSFIIPCEEVAPLIYPTIPAIICLSCPNSETNNRTKCGICSKLIKNTSGRQ